MAIQVIKKDGSIQDFNAQKIVDACNKSAERVIYRPLNEKESAALIRYVEEHIDMAGDEQVTVQTLHNYVEGGLDYINPKICASYRDYRDRMGKYKDMMARIELEANTVYYDTDDGQDADSSKRSNSNQNDALVSTKRCKVFDKLNTELYEQFFLTDREQEAAADGYIYIHDKNARRDTMNCCLFDIAKVLTGGFEYDNMWYNEPKSLNTAFDVRPELVSAKKDIVLMAASQQYGGFTLPEIDKVLSPYAEKSFNAYVKEYVDECGMEQEAAEALARKKVVKDAEQGFQGWEYKFNTVGSSRGDYPFTTLSGGLATDVFGKMIWKACLKVRREGQGKAGNKKPVLFPKLVFLYDENIHGAGKVNEDVFEAGIECSSKCMYPDWLSMSGKGYISEMYQKYGKAISPMGCRAFLSPWFIKDGDPLTGSSQKVDETFEPVFVGRFNIGAVSLNLPMILAKAKEEYKGADEEGLEAHFYSVLDYYMELIRGLHLRTYAYLGEMKASSNPLAYTQGGFLGGNLKLTDKIAPLLNAATASFGITAFEELQHLWNGNSLADDGEFALRVLRYINTKVNEFKEADGRLYAIYGTPAESLCSRQVK